jgi:hypothetical protein
MHTYKFSEYDFNLPVDMKNEVVSLVLSKLNAPVDMDIVDNALEDCIESNYQFARSENKFDREVDEVTSEDLANSIVDSLTEVIG